MISIISTNNSSNVQFIERQLAIRGLDKTTVIASANNMPTYINTSIVFSNVVILVGDTFQTKQAVARTLDFPLLYDKATQTHIVKYCKSIGTQLPAQHTLDNLSCNPEGFVSIANHSSLQCACYGQFKKTTVFILPDNISDISYVYNNYVSKIIDKLYPAVNTLTYKVFGLTSDDINAKLTQTLNARVVSHFCETTPDLVSTIVVRPATKLSRSQLDTINGAIVGCFGSNLYATTDSSLAEVAVKLLTELHKTVAVAESITGGMIASTLVDVSGASKVLLESAVTYTLSAKHKRLGINPHMIDAFGVVSSQVATAMVDNIKQQSGADFAISTTGYAGPAPCDGLPVGLCFVGIANHNNSNVYKLQLSGDRQNIRKQVTNSALLLLINTIKNVKI